MLWLAITVPALVFACDGSDRWRACGRQVAWSALGGAAVCGAILGYAVARASLAEMRDATYTWVLGNYAAHHVGRMSWAGYSWLWANGLPFTWEWLLQVVPAVLALEVAATLWRIRREGLRHQVMRAAVLLLAVLMAASILYFPDYIHVAFILPYSLVVLAGMACAACGSDWATSRDRGGCFHIRSTCGSTSCFQPTTRPPSRCSIPGCTPRRRCRPRSSGCSTTPMRSSW